MISPPAPPDVPLGCYDPATDLTRYRATIPADRVPGWSALAPVITAYSEPGLRNLRVRFYADPDGDFDPDDAPCDFVLDLVMSYIPIAGTMIIDTARRSVDVVTSTGHRRRADALVFSTDGKPVDWNLLSCGYGYVVTFDTPEGDPAPVIDLSFTPVAV